MLLFLIKIEAREPSRASIPHFREECDDEMKLGIVLVIINLPTLVNTAGV
ncbi:hypothetical protein [Fictibacillus barbaricus]|uniref:Uncharacterized protein n=1 Tax=Fictibacillus barbaricus TaxID=182136 RepID=A0ABU1U3H9_9BACL|nr:hypothetical protein [Fictibacillus barbaricus]MDR7074051.1 hypothetical protein [Fictibacillus barbaricus]